MGVNIKSCIGEPRSETSMRSGRGVKVDRYFIRFVSPSGSRIGTYKRTGTETLSYVEIGTQMSSVPDFRRRVIPPLYVALRHSPSGWYPVTAGYTVGFRHFIWLCIWRTKRERANKDQESIFTFKEVKITKSEVLDYIKSDYLPHDPLPNRRDHDITIYRRMS